MNISADFKKYIKDPGPLKSESFLSGLTISQGALLNQGASGVIKLNRGVPYSWIFHAKVGCIKIRLNLWSVFLQISRIFLQHFPARLLDHPLPATQREERQRLHNLCTKLSMNIPSFWAPNATRLSARCHFAGPKKLSISRAQPPSTCPRKGCCLHQKHYARGRINHRC